MQVIVMTSDNQYHCLPAYCHLFDKYFGLSQVKTIFCGFSDSLTNEEWFWRRGKGIGFYSIGAFDDYPPNRWSDALIKVLDNVAEEVFMLLLGDFWLTRYSDTFAVKMCYDYLKQFRYVIKMDLTTDRLYAEGGGKYLFGYHTYDTLGYLDLIKSTPGSPYHMSLWGGLWNRDLLRKILIPGETAQQIELNGTSRLSQFGDEMLVLGTRQSPIRHANVVQAGAWNNDVMVGLPSVKESDLRELKELGYL